MNQSKNMSNSEGEENESETAYLNGLNMKPKKRGREIMERDDE